ncbi:NAD-dependent epimerase/dehydratase family protein [Agromyces larvae]|uniref:NAD(P)-dependent oxidoreductase n=1 Tax=Agromyces larvae TaxID=2929802 RepID=A0ABY4BUI9_9MICO|nr:NAD(P)-dependent oxidoreductase [Agromyces larvae]UOE42878.1 NAD(P)-dependent oxidoreductase [Agromyces larvae]
MSIEAATARDHRPQLVVITGASGRIGSQVVPLLDRAGRTLRLVDTELPERVEEGPWGMASGAPLRGSIELHRASIERDDEIRAAVRGADAVVHLAALASERPWADLVRVNIDGTQRVLEAAHLGGVRRVLLASSIHAVGFAHAGAAATTPVLVPRPDTFYGVSKAAVEALGSVYADRYGMSVVSARICAFGAEPLPGGDLGHWLSPGDAARLIEAAIALDDGRHHIVWGVSANAPGGFDLRAGWVIGFDPEDDAVRVLTERDGVAPESARSPAAARGPIGGEFTDADHPLGEQW